MDRTISALFERALEDEPPAPPGNPAHEAITEGSRLRRRRRVLAGGAVAAGVVAIAFAVLAVFPGARPADTPAAGPAGCGISVFLGDAATEADLVAVQEALDADPQVRGFRYESSEEAFQRFKTLWQDNPDLVKDVAPDSLPRSFRVQLDAGAGKPAIATKVASMRGVEDVTQDPACSGAKPKEGK